VIIKVLDVLLLVRLNSARAHENLHFLIAERRRYLMQTHISPDLKILIVDDFATMRHIMRKSLMALGLGNVTEAADGLDALEKLVKEDFGLIISDWNMPNMMGIEFLRQVRANPRHSGTPFLMVTAEAKRENVLEAASAGVSQYIVKPFTVDSLQQKIAAIFERRAREAHSSTSGANQQGTK
jgi:two-component system chemotaxis response regulator CheY